MANRERRIERAVWLMQRDVEQLGTDLRSARLAAGLTLAEVGRRIGMSAAGVMRTERARAPGRRPEQLARHAAAVGLRTRIKAYPDGEPLRDAGQVDMAKRFRQRVLAIVPMDYEVPVSAAPGDLRAWDAVLALPGCRCAIEFVTRFYDCQAQLRAFQLKLRDGDVDRLIVVVRAAHANRRALTAAAHVLATDFPLGTRTVLAALVAGRDPGANGIVLL